MRFTVLASLLAASISFCVNAAIVIPPAPTVDAGGFMLMDHQTGHIIAEKNIDQSLAPASLTKIMTVYVVGKEIQLGNISLTDMVTVSEKAWAKNFPESSKMFIEVGTQVSVSDLLKGIVVQSGNDACVAIAEHVAGSESAFASMMNAYAQNLGMTSTNFVNSHGLDDPEQYTSPRDMAMVSSALIKEMPEIYKIYSIREFTYNGIRTANRNSLLWDKSLNVDGIKTGHTSNAGYSLISSATQGDMRLISVVMGTPSKRARKEENKSYCVMASAFESVVPFESGHVFAKQRIYMGNKETVDLGINTSTAMTIPRGQAKELAATFELTEKLEAPLEKGKNVGTLVLTLDGEKVATYPLVTLEEIQEGSLYSQAKDWVYLQLGFE